MAFTISECIPGNWRSALRGTDYGPHDPHDGEHGLLTGTGIGEWARIPGALTALSTEE